MFKDGRLKYSNMTLKQSMEIYPQITINSLSITGLRKCKVTSALYPATSS